MKRRRKKEQRGGEVVVDTMMIGTGIGTGTGIDPGEEETIVTMIRTRNDIAIGGGTSVNGSVAKVHDDMITTRTTDEDIAMIAIWTELGMFRGGGTDPNRVPDRDRRKEKGRGRGREEEMFPGRPSMSRRRDLYLLDGDHSLVYRHVLSRA